MRYQAERGEAEMVAPYTPEAGAWTWIERGIVVDTVTGRREWFFSYALAVKEATLKNSKTFPEIS